MLIIGGQELKYWGWQRAVIEKDTKKRREKRDDEGQKRRHSGSYIQPTTGILLSDIKFTYKSQVWL